MYFMKWTLRMTGHRPRNIFQRKGQFEKRKTCTISKGTQNGSQNECQCDVDVGDVGGLFVGRSNSGDGGVLQHRVSIHHHTVRRARTHVSRLH